MNNLTKHTPGPWRIEKPTEFGGLNSRVIAFGGKTWQQFGAIFNGDFGWSEDEKRKYKEEANANAELIRRAPELLEENESLKIQLAVERHDWRFSDLTNQIIELKQANKELLEALETALQYMNVFMIRGEEPLVGENLKTDLYTVNSLIEKHKS